MLHETFCGSALSGGIPALENQDEFLAGCFHPLLNFKQFNLQLGLVFFISSGAYLVLVGIFAVLKNSAYRIWIVPHFCLSMEGILSVLCVIGFCLSGLIGRRGVVVADLRQCLAASRVPCIFGF